LSPKGNCATDLKQSTWPRPEIRFFMSGFFKPAVQQYRPSLQMKPSSLTMPTGNGVSFAAQQNFSSMQMKVLSPRPRMRIFSRSTEL